jgi:hypothetical protein
MGRRDIPREEQLQRGTYLSTSGCMLNSQIVDVQYISDGTSPNEEARDKGTGGGVHDSLVLNGHGGAGNHTR